MLLGIAAGLFPDLDVAGAELERLPVRAAALVKRGIATSPAWQKYRRRRKRRQASKRHDIPGTGALHVATAQPGSDPWSPLRSASWAARSRFHKTPGLHPFLTGAALFAALYLCAALAATSSMHSALAACAAWMVGYQATWRLTPVPRAVFRFSQLRARSARPGSTLAPKEPIHTPPPLRLFLSHRLLLAYQPSSRARGPHAAPVAAGVISRTHRFFR